MYVYCLVNGKLLKNYAIIVIICCLFVMNTHSTIIYSNYGMVYQECMFTIYIFVMNISKKNDCFSAPFLLQI